MIPQNSISIENIDIKEQPNKTYALDPINKVIVGTVDGLAAVKQTVFKILNTERYDFIIYSWNMGIELKELYGKHKNYVISELKRRIKEALLAYNRVIDVSNFAFDFINKNTVITHFKVDTDIGSFEVNKQIELM